MMEIENVPAGQIEPWKSQILGADHQRDQEISQHGRNRRDQEEKDHHYAVHGKELVVGFC